MRFVVNTVLIAVWFILPAQLWAHADIEEQIELVTGLIAQRPDNAALYFRRGELYRYHQDWERALADFATALRYDSQMDKARIAQAATHLESGQPATARPLLDEFLADHSNDVEA